MNADMMNCIAMKRNIAAEVCWQRRDGETMKRIWRLWARSWRGWTTRASHAGTNYHEGGGLLAKKLSILSPNGCVCDTGPSGDMRIWTQSVPQTRRA